IPLVLYFKGGRAKVKLGLCRGKTHEDRRQGIKERETKREMDRAIRRH
ncbi:MAG: SsrA-binding protein, partial [Myxococcaceae bacterium]